MTLLHTDHEINNSDRIREPGEDQMYTTVEPEVQEPSLEEIKALVESLKNNKNARRGQQNPGRGLHKYGFT